MEPLHFTCHAASDGTKVEKVDTTVTVINPSTLYDHGPSTNATTSDNKIFNQAYVSIKSLTLLSVLKLLNIIIKYLFIFTEL